MTTKYFAKRIVEARRRANLTQTDLAERSGIAQPNIARLESGAVSPAEETLERIASGLGIEMHELVCDRLAKTRELLRDAASEGIVAYLTADWGDWFEVSKDGSWSITEGNAYQSPDDEPLVEAKCPGIGNLDGSRYREGLAELLGEAEEEVAEWELSRCIEACDEQGVLGDEIDELADGLIEALESLTDDFYKHDVDCCPVCGKERE
jgi:transcriptional regulator with XRE-family HTH domain